MSILDKDISYIRTNKGIFMEEKIYDELVYRIHHLEKENEELKETIYELQENEGLKQANKILEENWLHYMKCCEKAIEYIKYNDSDLYTYEPDYDYEENLVDNYEPSNFREDLLNILQNGSDEE